MTANSATTANHDMLSTGVPFPDGSVLFLLSAEKFVLVISEEGEQDTVWLRGSAIPGSEFLPVGWAVRRDELDEVLRGLMERHQPGQTLM